MPPRIVFFDGVCVFCHATTRWLIARDPEARLHFAPLQGETAALLRAAQPEFPVSIDTLVYADLGGEEVRLLLRSSAVFEILGELGRSSWWLRLLSALPTALTDLAYAAFVRVRYRVFGRLATCPLPSAEERARFLD